METRGNQARIEWNEHPIVRVEASVMARGEVGWTPYLGGGHSKVAIYESVKRDNYWMYGYKIQDRMITLDSLIPPQMPLIKANDVFHHWVIGGQRMGLAFNGTVDARSFDRGIRIALENLEKAHQNTSMSSGSSTCSRTSDEPHSASPTSNRSFSLPSSDETTRLQNQPHAVTAPIRQTALLPRQLTISTLPGTTFRHQTLSASSWHHTAPPSRVQRRHSSSVPGRAHRYVSVPSPKSVVTTFDKGYRTPPPLPSCTPTPPAALESPIKDADEQKKNSPTLPLPLNEAPDTTVQSAMTSQRRHRHRHHRHESSSRTRRTKTPNLDHLERQRDSQPTKSNSYVQFASSRANSARHSAIIPMKDLSSEPNEDRGFKSFSSRYGLHRSGQGGVYDCRYQGVKTQDDFRPDFCGKMLYHGNPMFSYSDPVSVLKQPALLKTDYSKGGKQKEDLAERSRCRYCQAMFNIDKNRPGECPDAPPDSCQICIERATCMCLAHSFLYNCFRDSEGNYDNEPCSCSRHYSRRSSKRRWIVLIILSIFVPCLCLYPLLRSCHKCGVACHCCGGSHEVMPLNRNDSNHASPTKR